MQQDKGHCCVSRACRTRPFLVIYYLPAFAGAWVLCSVIPISQGLGSLWICMRCLSFLPALQHVVLPPLPQQPAAVCIPLKRTVRSCAQPCRLSMVILLLPPASVSLPRRAGGCLLPAACLAGPCLARMLIPSWVLYFVINWAVSCRGSTKQACFQFHFPLAQGIVSYSWRCFLFFFHYSLLARREPEKQVDKLNEMFCLPFSNALKTHIS